MKNFVPNWLRVMLSILSFISFLPHFLRIFKNKDSKGVSLYYVLFNLLSATEQFTLGFFYALDPIEEPDFFVDSPRTAGDWLNFAQLSVVWIMSVLFFIMCLCYAQHTPRVIKSRVIAIFLAFLLISVGPIFVDAVSNASNRERVDDNRRWFGALFFGVHSMMVNPVITLLGFCSLVSQMSQASALSLLGLVGQALVFALVALSWTARVKFPYDVGRPTVSLLVTWYRLVGWAAVDNAVFAFVQFVLFCIAKRAQHPGAGDSSIDPEQQPLLTH